METTVAIHECEKCHTTSTGKYYTFYYGKQVGSRREPLVLRYFYQVAGSKTAWICNRCWWRGFFTHPQTILAPVIAIVILISYLQVSEYKDRLDYFISTYFIILTFVLVFGNGFLTNFSFDLEFFDFIVNVGVRQAMKVYRKQLAQQGYHVLFTPKKYQFLQTYGKQ